MWKTVQHLHYLPSFSSPPPIKQPHNARLNRHKWSTGLARPNACRGMDREACVLMDHLEIMDAIDGSFQGPIKSSWILCDFPDMDRSPPVLRSQHPQLSLVFCCNFDPIPFHTWQGTKLKPSWHSCLHLLLFWPHSIPDHLLSSNGERQDSSPFYLALKINVE